MHWHPPAPMQSKVNLNLLWPFLLLIDLPEGEKRELLAHSYERRAALSEKKAQQLDIQFHRSFPLIKLEAQKDRQVARSIRQGKEVHTSPIQNSPSF